MQKQSDTNFNLQDYLSRYTGHTKIMRCQFIAINATDDQLSRNAFKECVQLLKNTTNSSMYQNLMEKAQEKYDAETFPIDVEWIMECESRSKSAHGKLDESLKKFKMAGVKENVRLAHNQLAETGAE